MTCLKYPFPKDSRFLVTGGAGFIGSNLVERIIGLVHEVIILDNFSTGKEENIKAFMNNPNFKLIEGDIRNIDDCRTACKNADYVLHQAALASVPRSVANPIAANEVNVAGTLNMLTAARECNVKRFVYASSSSVYGDEPSLPKVEDRLGKPLSPYAVSKITCEHYAKNFYDLFGLQTVGLRYFNIFGENQDPDSEYSAVIPVFIKKLLSNKSPTIYGDGMHSRDFTYVENVIQANLKACLAGEEACGEVFNIACGDTITLNDLYLKLCKLLDVNIEPIYASERYGDIKHSNADVSKAKRVLGYCPEYDLDAGVELSIDWYKKHLWR